MAPQWVVASTPVEQAGRRQHAASRCTPTSSTGCVGWTRRTQSSSGSVGRHRARAGAAGHDAARRRCGDVGEGGAGDDGAFRCRCGTSALLAPTKTISAPGRRESTSYGPMASRAVKRSKRAMAIFMRCLLSGSGAQEMTPVGSGAHPERSLKDAVHGGERRRSRRRRRPRRGRASCSRAAGARASSACSLDERGRRAADLALEHAREVARAHRDAARRGRAPTGPRSRWSAIHAWRSRSGLRSRRLRGELHAELRLPAGALEEQHQPARDLARHAAVPGRRRPARARGRCPR